MDTVYSILASGGTGAFIVLLFFVIKWLMDKKGESKIKTQNGNINITNQTKQDTANELIIKMLETQEKKLDLMNKEITKNIEDTKRLSRAFSVYVRHNGAKPEIKEIISQLLDTDNKE
ncbi:hypothetical protein [Mycoplasmopsis gallinacea]|uniref:Uncharacterized protein n=1 Tax=Mycoplasmopsis gallinacea TaxID=29556 RepID=A0A6H0V465_9BACT|nr:hypothetical protein [Mycoplasmopsis gallinacea]QIW62524.1 hypothetical protein GOQ20_03840 [Mycoplasmopsis gallinacea]